MLCLCCNKERPLHHRFGRYGTVFRLLSEDDYGMFARKEIVAEYRDVEFLEQFPFMGKVENFEDNLIDFNICESCVLEMFTRKKIKIVQRRDYLSFPFWTDCCNEFNEDEFSNPDNFLLAEKETCFPYASSVHCFNNSMGTYINPQRELFSGVFCLCCIKNMRDHEIVNKKSKGIKYTYEEFLTSSPIHYSIDDINFEIELTRGLQKHHTSEDYKNGKGYYQIATKVCEILLKSRNQNRQIAAELKRYIVKRNLGLVAKLPKDLVKMISEI